MKNLFPDFAMKCLKKIESAGYEAWFVGGCVRDSLIGRDFSDVDITTNALPEEIEALFDKTIPTGKKHGTITVLIDKNPIEVTTYRSEFGYDDSRHPNEIRFEKDISADLSRRDFTINALAYNPEKNILDIYGGQKDLEKGIIKTVGNPQERFSEDALRILRAFRFASQLEYSIEDATVNAALNLGKSLDRLSGERVLSELKKLSRGKNPYVIDELLNTGCLSRFGIGKFRIKTQSFIDIDENYKTPLFFFICEHDSVRIKERLKADNKLIRQLEALDRFTEELLPQNKNELKNIFRRYFDYSALYLNYIKLVNPEYYETISGFAQEIFNNREPFLIQHLAIGGNELLKLGIKSEHIGKMLEKLALAVIEKPEINCTDLLIAEAEKLNRIF